MLRSLISRAAFTPRSLLQSNHTVANLPQIRSLCSAASASHVPRPADVFAVVSIKGKQYKVRPALETDPFSRRDLTVSPSRFVPQISEEDVILAEKLPSDVGESLTFEVTVPLPDHPETSASRRKSHQRRIFRPPSSGCLAGRESRWSHPSRQTPGRGRQATKTTEHITAL